MSPTDFKTGNRVRATLEGVLTLGPAGGECTVTTDDGRHHVIHIGPDHPWDFEQVEDPEISVTA